LQWRLRYETATVRAAPTTYLITFVCYGARLPGEPGAISRIQNQFASPLPEADGGKEQQARNRMTQQPYVLDCVPRDAVLRTLQEVCSCRGWRLLAAHVRTNRVHVVITADHSPERVMNTLKAYSSRALNRMALDSPDRRRWARHGSTRYLWTSDSVSAAEHYVVHEQGEPMAVFEMAYARADDPHECGGRR